jgi:ABC-2 type transport system permease protein
MNMFWQQLKIEMKLFLRDRQTVFWTYFFPLFLILVFGFVFSQNGLLKLHVGLVDNDVSHSSREFIKALDTLPTLTLHKSAQEVIEEEIRTNIRKFAIRIPKGYASQLNQGSAYIEILYNRSEQSAFNVLQAIIEKHITRQNWQLLAITPPVQIKPHPITAFRTEQRYIDFVVPGLIGFSLMSTCLFSIGVVVVSYREKGKLRRLSVTPLPKYVFIAGQIANRYIIVFMQALLLLGVAFLLFHVKMVGNPFTLFIVLTVGMLCFIVIGYAVASLAKTTESASGIANVLFFPMIFLSGVYFSVENMPAFLQPVITFLPLTHLVYALRIVFNEGATLLEVAPRLGILSIWFFSCFLFSIYKFKWEV